MSEVISDEAMADRDRVSREPEMRKKYGEDTLDSAADYLESIEYDKKASKLAKKIRKYLKCQK